MADQKACAALAARFMDEDGLERSQARAKAARLLGAREPGSEDLEAALLERFALFKPREHARLLAERRRQALRLMRRLAPWAPRLAGPVASGSACPQDPIVLALAGCAKDIEFFLMDQGIPYSALREDGRGGETLGLQLAAGTLAVLEISAAQGPAAWQISESELAALVSAPDGEIV